MNSDQSERKGYFVYTSNEENYEENEDINQNVRGFYDPSDYHIEDTKSYKDIEASQREEGAEGQQPHSTESLSESSNEPSLGVFELSNKEPSGTKPTSQNPLFSLRERSWLPILLENIEDVQTYDRIKKGKAKETKTLKTYFSRQSRYLKSLHKYGHLSERQFDEVREFKNNLQGIQLLYGFSEKTPNNFVDSNQHDHIRRQCLKYCQLSAPSILQSLNSLEAKLSTIKYLSNFERMVIEPERSNQWKPRE